RKTPRECQTSDLAQVASMVSLGSELVDAAAEKPELHPELDGQAMVVSAERLEDREKPRDVAAPAVGARIGSSTQSIPGQLAQPVEHQPAIRRCRKIVTIGEAGFAQSLPHRLPSLVLIPIEQAGKCGGIEGERCTTRGGPHRAARRLAGTGHSP